MISLDISNAFNSVRWSDIIRILFEEEVPEYLIQMIKDFLSDRFIVDEENCFEFQYNVGVPQGSCLGPILFLLIADRLLRDLNTDDKTKVIMFADDILTLTADSAVYRFSESTKIPLDKVLAGIPPLDLSIKFHQEKFMLIKLKNDILINDELLIASNVNVPPPRVPSWRGRRSFWNIEHSNSNMNNESNFNYYTDGSKIDGRTGCGIALFRGGEEIKTLSIRLNNDSSVFMADAYAIKTALLEAQSLNDSTTPVHIFTDSMSVLKSFEVVNDRFQIITDMKTISENLNCFFHWVKVHVGTHDNERADILAKEATYKDDVDVFLGTPRSLNNLKIRNQILNSWQFRRANSLQSRFTFGLCPDVDLKRCFGDFFIN
ncbi:hypothetical protein AVEN_103195-1 [Araneus ventricosus]|uniref:Uncharacterized protein n=1 Tax=Araneus ventricosus TaxID=182803 RepID=A0A4Y2FUA1_ARAVE|nr:hypothetical protein AVEN_103195-1 [Araneus ventricosus]